MDGLLFDTERLFQEAWRDEAAAMNLTLPDIFTSRVCGTSGEKQAEIVREFFPGGDPEKIMANVQNRVYEQKEIPVKKGTFEILKGMKEQGICMAVASSSPLQMIERNLRKTGTSEYFDCIVSGLQVSNGKPEPDIFLLAAEKTGFSPSECYVFEDSLNGIIAGFRAGCASIMIPDIVPPTEEIKKIAAGIFPDLSEAWEAIRKGDL